MWSWGSWSWGGYCFPRPITRTSFHFILVHPSCTTGSSQCVFIFSRKKKGEGRQRNGTTWDEKYEDPVNLMTLRRRVRSRDGRNRHRSVITDLDGKWRLFDPDTGLLRQTISQKRNSDKSFFTQVWRYDATGPDIFSRFMTSRMNPLRTSSLFHTRHEEGKEEKESGQTLQESITRATGKGFVQGSGLERVVWKIIENKKETGQGVSKKSNRLLY